MLRLTHRSRSRSKTISMPGWAFGLMAAGSAALGIALFLIVSALAVLLLPLVLAAGAVTAFVMRKRIEKLVRAGGFPGMTQGAEDAVVKTARRRAQQRVKPDIEDAEYRVVSEPPKRTG
jgi:hypothetical protein